jgi:hypothetical protein
MADDPDFEEADASTDALVELFTDDLESLMGKWQDVAPSHIVERVLVRLSEDLPALTDDLKIVVGPATSRLLDALAAYRDSQAEDR